MQIILSILLYLNVISSPGTYFVSEINNDIIQNQKQITKIELDPTLVNNIVTKYQGKIVGITILDDGQLK